MVAAIKTCSSLHWDKGVACAGKPYSSTGCNNSMKANGSGGLPVLQSILTKNGGTVTTAQQEPKHVYENGREV